MDRELGMEGYNEIEYLAGVLACAEQESRIRQWDENGQVILGDNGHAHGIYQIHDKWFNENGKGYYRTDVERLDKDIYYNIEKGVRHYTEKYKRALNLGYKPPARAAYSAYNGGRYGRYLKKGNYKWKKNDDGFYDNYYRWLKKLGRK